MSVSGSRSRRRTSSIRIGSSEGRILHLNTNLELTSSTDLTDLAAAFEDRGLIELRLIHRTDDRWYATFEAGGDHEEPETTIAALIDAVESLPDHLREVWSGCTQRELNIGYDCGQEPWGFNQGLSTELLARIVAVGGTLRITIYPETDDEAALRECAPGG